MVQLQCLRPVANHRTIFSSICSFLVPSLGSLTKTSVECPIHERTLRLPPKNSQYTLDIGRPSPVSVLTEYVESLVFPFPDEDDDDDEPEDTPVARTCSPTVPLNLLVFLSASSRSTELNPE